MTDKIKELKKHVNEMFEALGQMSKNDSPECNCFGCFIAKNVNIEKSTEETKDRLKKTFAEFKNPNIVDDFLKERKEETKKEQDKQESKLSPSKFKQEKKTGMNFIEAVRWSLNGSELDTKTIRWFQRNSRPDVRLTASLCNRIHVKINDTTSVSYSPSVRDILATDWVVVEEYNYNFLKRIKNERNI